MGFFGNINYNTYGLGTESIKPEHLDRIYTRYVNLEMKESSELPTKLNINNENEWVAEVQKTLYNITFKNEPSNSKLDSGNYLGYAGSPMLNSNENKYFPLFLIATKDSSKVVSGNIYEIRFTFNDILRTSKQATLIGPKIKEELITNTAVTTNKIKDKTVTYNKLHDNVKTDTVSKDDNKLISSKGVYNYTNPNFQKYAKFPNDNVDEAIDQQVLYHGYVDGLFCIVFCVGTSEYQTQYRYTSQGYARYRTRQKNSSGSWTEWGAWCYLGDSKNIPDGAIITSKINDKAVTEGKINDKAITEGKIADGAVTEGKIYNEAVTTNKIADSAVTEGKIANNAVTDSKIADEQIQEKHLSQELIEILPKISIISYGEASSYDFKVPSSFKGKLGDIAIVETSSGSYLGGKLYMCTSIESKYGFQAYHWEKLNEIADNAVTANKIENNAIITDKINNNAVTSAKIADKAVTTDKIADKAIGSSQLKDGSINLEHLSQTFIDKGGSGNPSLAYAQASDNRIPTTAFLKTFLEGAKEDLQSKVNELEARIAVLEGRSS